MCYVQPKKGPVWHLLRETKWYLTKYYFEKWYSAKWYSAKWYFPKLKLYEVKWHFTKWHIARLQFAIKLWEMVFCELVYYEIVLCAVVLLRNLNLLNGHNVIKTWYVYFQLVFFHKSECYQWSNNWWQQLKNQFCSYFKVRQALERNKPLHASFGWISIYFRENR